MDDIASDEFPSSDSDDETTSLNSSQELQFSQDQDVVAIVPEAAEDEGFDSVFPEDLDNPDADFEPLDPETSTPKENPDPRSAGSPSTITSWLTGF